MNEILGAGILLVLVFGSFGVFWKIIQDVKKSAHARIDRLDTDMKDMKVDCNKRLSTYVNKNDMDGLRCDMNSQFNNLTTRIDSLLLVFKNGNRNN